MQKYDVFSGIKVIKINFSVIFNEEIRALEGFYHDFSTKKASASGASPPDPHQGALPPGPPRFFCPPEDLP